MSFFKKPMVLWALAIVVLALLVLLARGLQIKPHDLPFMSANKPLPDFVLPVLQDKSKTVTPEDLKGKVWLIHFWASWCGVCLDEHAFLMRLKESRVHVLGVDYRDDIKEAEEFLASRGDPFTLSVADATGQLGIELGVYGTPETYLIDKEGVVRYRFVGALDRDTYNAEFAPRIKALEQESAHENVA